LALKLGIDVGGTHTDSVVLNETNELVGAVKSPTTPDVTSGIVTSLDMVLDKTNVDVSEIKYAAIGTTHCINAIVERRRLAKVAAIRLCLPAGVGVEPMTGWPEDLKSAIGNTSYLVAGGYEYDGREFNSLDFNGLEEIGEEIKEKKIEAVAITGQFAPVRNEQEVEAGKVLRRILGPSIPISLSHEIGSIGLIERENATILNAAIIKVATAAAEAFESSLRQRGLVDAKVFFSQNDGTLMSVEYAKRYPILTISSGPTNSIRGAGFLTGLTDAIVVDIGGTTTLVGILVKGFPRQSSTSIEVGGVKTNFRMPDLVSIGNGGGSIVRRKNGQVTVGPDSVGYEIIRKAVAWGGDTITTTDVALAAGYAKIEEDPRVDIERSKEILDDLLVTKASEKIIENVENAIDKIKTSAEPMPVVLVGGGGVIIPPYHYKKLKGTSKVIRPQSFQYANAIGAAIAQVSGEIDRVFALEQLTREEALKQAKEMAVRAAISAGADPDRVQVVDIDEIFLSYLPSNAARIRVKAAGPLKV
jgi:N-methylhydantoinase A/oxoprolinase/acetone carboxylase beta subunit